MALDLNQINQILSAPRNKKVISKAVNLERRLRFHTETNISSSDIYQPAQTFLDWVNSLIPKDKFNTFLQLFSFPLPTPAVVEDVYRELERVFYSRNSSCSYQFADSTLADDWHQFRISMLGQPDIWKTKGWQQMKVAVNSVLIVDLPAEQIGNRPEPYFYWLDIASVIDYESPNGQDINWIIFKQDNDNIAVFDNQSMRVFKVDKQKVTGLVSEAKHDLGFCPARFFWSTYLTENEKALKKNPITKELSNLDWLLFFTISKRHLDLYAPYPIYSAYEADCSFENNETGSYCDGGFLRNADGNYMMYGDGLQKCPACSEKRIAGPGSFIEVPVPTVENADMRSPVQITTIDDKSLAYNVKECDRLKNDILVSCIGSDGMVSEKEAINETQIIANFESKTAVLNSLKTNFEQAQKFVETTICKLRYGSDFLSLSISWGTEFYVLTVNELYDKYEMAKKQGSSNSELDSLLNKILETEYKHNPIQLQRMQILKQIEPYRHYTLDEVLKMYDKGLLSHELVVMKINFNELIDKFERENINIVEFASALPFEQKIKLLTKQLNEYVKNIPAGKPQQAQSNERNIARSKEVEATN